MQLCRKGGGAGSASQTLLLPLIATALWIASPTSSQITFTNPPSDLVVAEGSPARFDCEFSTSTSVSISWEKDGATVTPVGRFSYLVNGSLSISPTQAGDNGTYSCVVADQSNQQREERSASLTFAFILNSFLSSPDSQTVAHGATFILFCTHGGSLPAATIAWTHDNDIIVTSSRILIQQSTLGHADPPQVSSSLVIASAVGSDSGSYACVASNPLLAPSTAVTSTPATVTVRAPFSVPTITQHPTDIIAIPGQSAILSCSFSGEPPPSIAWSHDNVTLTPSSQVSITTTGVKSSLTLSGVQESNSGEYRCRATNSQGSTVSQPAQLQIASIGTTFELQPQDTVIAIGGVGVLNCLSPPSLPSAQISWTKNFAQLQNSQRFTVLQNGSLMITGAELEDQGVYYCTATNTLLGISRTSQPAQVTTIGVPTVVPSTVTVDSGQSVTLLCSARGNPAPTFSWFKGETQLLDSDPRLSITGGTLTISDIAVDDRGYYTCRATFAAGTTEARAYVSVRSLPEFVNTNISITTVVQSEVTLPCDIIPDPTVTFSWQFGGVLLNPRGGTYTILPDGSLVVANVGEAHEGTYTCVVTNPLGVASGTVILTVNTPPTVTADSTTVVTIEGNTVALVCNATGDPVPVQTWSRNGNELTSGGRYRISSDGRVLTVQGVTEAQDEGEFTCHASNLAGNDSADIILNVLIPPRFTQPPTNSTAVEGAQHILTCAATGDPTPLVTWSSSDGMVVSSQGTLLFSSVARGDSGLYTCIASSSAGSVEVEIYLDVQYPPAILQPPQSQSVALNSTFVFVCITDGNPPPQISWLFNDAVIPGAVESSYTVSMVAGTNGGQYTCRATNNIGAVSQSATLTVLFPPSSPTLLLATAISPSTFSVQWTPSTNDGGSPITSYVIEYRDTSLISGPFQSVRVGSDATSTQLSGLAAFVNYEIRVRGENAVGLSDPSNTISGRTHPDAPSAPGNFRVTSFSSSTVSLAWDIPDPLNGQLAAYELSYTDEMTSATNTRLLFAVTRFTISGLRVGVVYRVELRASTASLLGDFLYGPYAVLRVRDGVELEVPTEAPPTTPPPTTTEDTEETTTPSDQGTTQAAVATTTDRQVGMTTATNMVATTTEDAGMTTAPPITTEMEQSTTQPATTSAVLNPPSVAPSDLVVQPSAGQVFIVWREPSSGLDTFIGYQILISPAPPPPLTTPILRPSTPGMILYNYVITGLANFTEYTITVATYNDDGVGPLTAQTTITTPETAPSAPQSVATVTSPSGAVIVSWLPPEPRNGVILQYLVQVLLGATDQTINSQTVSVGSSMAEQEMGRSVTFVGLDLDNFQYRIEVHASTGAGTGPSSIPVFIGMNPATNATTTMVDPPTSTMAIDDNTTSSATNEITSSPSTTMEPTTDTLQTSIDNGTTTDALQTVTVGDTEAPAPFRNDEYYIVRIVPPVVIALFILVIVVVVVMGCCCRSRMNRENKKGLYTVYPPGDYVMRSKHTLEGDHAVAGDDDVETSSYHIKDALDANFTYNSHSNRQPPSARQHGLRAGVNNQSTVDRGQLESGSGLRRQPYQPGTGQGHHGGWQQQQQHQQYPATTAGWRDAAEEPDSRPDSGEVEIMPAEVDMELGGERERESLGSQSEGSMGSLQRLPYQPGDYTHAELDAMRAKKAQQRAKRFGVDDQQRTPHDHQQHVHQQQQYQQYHHHQLQQMTSSAAAPRQQGPPTATPMIFDPNLGFSNGGIMETKIGAVGGRAARDHIPPEASAHMY